MSSIVALLLALTSSVLPQPGVPPPVAQTASPQPESDLIAQAKAFMAQEDWNAAANALLKFLREQPNSPRASEVTFWVGYCQVKREEFEQAIWTLRPFQSALAEDKWADDALLQLGHAYEGADEGELALECWKRLIEKYPESVWRPDALLSIVNLLYWGENFAACLPYCEQVMLESTDPDTTWEPRYIGAYCLNALHRFEQAERWVDRWFDPTSGVQEAWRTTLGAQRDLLEGRTAAAMQAVESLREYLDLEINERLDVLMRASFMLRQNSHAGQARTLLVALVPRLEGHSTDDITWVLDELEMAVGEDHPQEYLDELAGLAEDVGTPLRVRVAVRDRHVTELREAGHSGEAVELLRRTLEKEQTEFPRFRATVLLAETLADDLDERDAALKLLGELLPTLKRRDFKHAVRNRLEEYRKGEDE